MTGGERRLRALLILAGNTVHPDMTVGLARIQARTRKTAAAPGHSGAAATAEPIREDTAMSHDFIEESTPRGRQLAAALALAHLLESGPPMVAEWRIDGLGRLHGQPADPRDDAGSRAALEAFAEFLKAPVKRSQGRNSHEEWLHLAVVGEYRGAAVRVWAHVDVRPVSPYASLGGAR